MAHPVSVVVQPLSLIFGFFGALAYLLNGVLQRDADPRAGTDPSFDFWAHHVLKTSAASESSFCHLLTTARSL